MTPQEKLKEIEKRCEADYRYLSSYRNAIEVTGLSQNGDSWKENVKDRLTLIFRIKELEAREKKLREALEKIKNTKWSSETVNPLKYIARQALAEGEEK